MQFKLAKGCNVKDLSGIEEGYEFNDNGKFVTFTLNISRENIEKYFFHLASYVNKPSFFLLEHPTNEKIEKKLRKSDESPTHKDVYYRDNLDFEDLSSIWDKCSNFCLDCGMTNFGFGSHEGIDEVFITRYKICYILSGNHEKYLNALAELNMPHVEKLKTVWDNINYENPGETSSLKFEDKTIYDVVEDLKEDGLYFYEHRED